MFKRGNLVQSRSSRSDSRAASTTSSSRRDIGGTWAAIALVDSPCRRRRVSPSPSVEANSLALTASGTSVPSMRSTSKQSERSEVRFGSAVEKAWSFFLSTFR